MRSDLHINLVLAYLLGDIDNEQFDRTLSTY